MEQYLELSKRILNEGVDKSSGRAGMPDTRSVFGHQMRFDLQKGFPLLTTKKVKLDNILVELIWFLKGDTNIKFLIDNGCDIWIKDCYRWFKTHNPDHEMANMDRLELSEENRPETDEEYFERCADIFGDRCKTDDDFCAIYGDLGGVYGSQWRNWENPKAKIDAIEALMKDTEKHASEDFDLGSSINHILEAEDNSIDQIADLVNGLRKNPYGRRHIVTAWNPAEVPTMALPPCHLLSHFNSRPATTHERDNWAWANGLKGEYEAQEGLTEDQWNEWHDSKGVPKIVLDCLLYQRSCDTFLGVPYNIASYAMLTMVMAKMTGMIEGEFIWTGGDTHFYSDHMDAVHTQLEREPRELPTLKISDRVATLDDPEDIEPSDFELQNYNPDKFIKAHLSVGTA